MRRIAVHGGARLERAGPRLRALLAVALAVAGVGGGALRVGGAGLQRAGRCRAAAVDKRRDVAREGAGVHGDHVCRDVVGRAGSLRFARIFGACAAGQGECERRK